MAIEWDDDFHMDLDELVDADLLGNFCATMSGLIKVRLQKMSLWLDAVDALTDSDHIKSQVAAWLTTEDSLRARFNSYWDAYSQKLNATDMLAHFEKIFYEIDMVQEITKANNFGQKWLMKEIKDAQTVENIKWFSELSYADLVVAYEPIHEKFKSDFQADVRNIMSSYLEEFDSTLENIDSKFDEIFSVRRVTHLKVIYDLKMLLLFDGDNQARSVDFSKIIPSNPSLTELTDPSLFKKAKIFGSAVRWEDLDIDIEAADLYEVSVTLDRYVAMWHQEKPNVSLQDYLGLNDEEYQAFAHGEAALTQKLNAQDIETQFNRGEDLSDFFATEVDPVTHQPKRKKS